MSESTTHDTSHRFLGAHVSTSGGPHTSPARASEIGANAFALFTKNQRRWNAKPYDQEEIESFHAELEKSGIDPLMVIPHGSYLINLGSPDDEVRRKSIDAVVDELTRTEQLGLTYLNIHPGSGKGDLTKEETIQRIADGANEALEQTKRAVLVLENTAGQGNVIGGGVSELGAIIELIGQRDRVGVCIDTCHAFAAGYDIRTADVWRSLLDEVDETCGKGALKGLHLNDSQFELGKNKDRHAVIGGGELGWDTFWIVLSDERAAGIPCVLETPEPDKWAEEIAALRELLAT